MSHLALSRALQQCAPEAAVPNPRETVASVAKQRVIVYCGGQFCCETTRGTLLSKPGSHPARLFQPGSEFLQASAHIRCEDGVWRWEIADASTAGPRVVSEVIHWIKNGLVCNRKLSPDSSELARLWSLL